MYLTRMFLNPRRRQAIRLKNDPQAMHAAVESAFPPRVGNARNLWRLDSSNNDLTLLLLSKSVPSLEHIQEQAGWSAEKTWETKDYEPLLLRIRKGQRYSFKLTANPTHIVTLPSGAKKRMAHVGVRYQLSWLYEKQDAIGARFGNLDAEGAEQLWSPRVTSRRTRKFRRGDHRVTLAEATFEGVLEVASADLLRAALTNGVGRGKAYGCGLLTLAPYR